MYSVLDESPEIQIFLNRINFIAVINPTLCYFSSFRRERCLLLMSLEKLVTKFCTIPLEVLAGYTQS